MKVLVTGAAGRIGAHLTRVLTERDHEVRAFVLVADLTNQQIDGPKVEVVAGNLENADDVARAVDGVDAIVALGGALTSRLATDQQFFDVNLGRNVQSAHGGPPVERPITRFVYASSDAVYHAGAGQPACFVPIDESHPTVPGSIYGATKLAAEELCRTFGRGFGLPVSIVRPTVTADAWELIEPDSVFGRRHFVGGSVRFLEKPPSRTAEEESLLDELRRVNSPDDTLYVVTDPDDHVGLANIADARDVADGTSSRSHETGGRRRDLQHRWTLAARRGRLRRPPCDVSAPGTGPDPTTSTPARLVCLEREGARGARI